ncbi:MAG TPA: alkaline phosphatase family protein [Gemmatales bacterium]|nr:alkaline phosphatase family protein [Gemmatales bacterium]
MVRATRIALILLVLLVIVPIMGMNAGTRIITLPVATAGQVHGPKLLVLVVFDQMRGDYLERWSKQFGTDGFNRLTSEGAWFTNCHYPYSMTLTGCGHATLGTGCIPAQHGIVENEWYDRSTGKNAYCATLGDRFKMIPDGAKSKSGLTGGGTPGRLLEPALGDVVKEVTNSKGKVIGVSLKDRGGVLPTGAKADICYWYDDNVGAFVTSNFYIDRLPSYMAKFNELKLADQWFVKDWTRLRNDINYTEFSGPDDVEGEGIGIKQGRTFPHPMTGGLDQPGPKFYDAIYTSPMGNDLTWQAAKAVLDNERLGQHEQTDYLVVSYSSNDSVGHVWGPDSQEVMDVTLRSDRIMADMINYLDAHVGRENYLMVVSADHGVCPLPEVSKAKGLVAGRVEATKEVPALEHYLSSKYQTTAKWTEAISGAGIYLNLRTIKAAGKTYQEVEQAVADWFKTRPYVLEVYTRSQLLDPSPLPGFGENVRKSFQPDRSGDVQPIMKPYHFLVSKYTTGTTHGSPHEYDTHVPLVFFGAGVVPGRRMEKVSPQLASVGLAHTLGQKMNNSTVEVPEGLFK